MYPAGAVRINCAKRDAVQKRHPVCLKELRELAGGVAQGLAGDAEAVQHRDQQVAHRGAVRVAHVAPGLDRAATPPAEQDRQVVVVVSVAIADAATVDQHGIVQKALVAFLDALQLVEDVGKLLNMELVDQADLLQLLGFLRKENLADLCISRPANRLSWGIPLPFAPEWVTYVWFDALVNYYTVPAALGDIAALTPLEGWLQKPATSTSLWPPDVHLIGKDIVKFHAVYWPIMLRALGAVLPKKLLVHGWWQKDGAKIAKSTGNIIDPVKVIQEWGLDAFRYYVVRELAIGPDGNWTDSGFAARYNAELANGLGNLVNRSISMLNRYRQGIVPALAHELEPSAASAVRDTAAALKEHRLQDALASIWTLVNRANKYVEETRPFDLNKDPAKAVRLDEVLYNLVESCRILAVLLSPFIPGTAERIYAQLKICGEPEHWRETTWGGLLPGHTVGSPEPLFPKKETAKST